MYIHIIVLAGISGKYMFIYSANNTRYIKFLCTRTRMQIYVSKYFYFTFGYRQYHILPVTMLSNKER